MSTALRLRGVTRVHGSGAGQIRALDGVDLDVDYGELAAIMGPSGSGTSTLLNIAGGLDGATDGEVLVGDVALGPLGVEARAAPRRTSIGYVFQDFDLIPVLTAAENVAVPIELDGMAARTARQVAVQALATVGLDGYADRMPDEMSAGQAQRVAIVGALVGPRPLPAPRRLSATAHGLSGRCDTGFLGVTLPDMPTTKPRHAITETETIARALSIARRRWPGQPSTRLLTHLIEAGASVVEREDTAVCAEHERAVAALTELAGYYQEGYLDDVRAGWEA